MIADLRELARRTSDERGAQRLCWSPTWREARELLGELLGRARARGRGRRGRATSGRGSTARDPAAPALALGSHVDSVPDGGWLDGALGVMAALGVLRAWASAGEPPAAPARAGRLGRRGGRALRAQPVRQLGVRGHARPGGGRRACATPTAGRSPRSWPRTGSSSTAPASARAGASGLGAYLELHIEQGPRMEAEGLRAAAVTGCAGVERLRFDFRGQASHAGTTPMDARRDAGLAAAEAALAIEAIPEAEGGVATTGELRLEPGIPTAIAGRAVLAVDLRHPEPEPLARMLDAARERLRATAAERAAASSTRRRCWRIEPIPFDTRARVRRPRGLRGRWPASRRASRAAPCTTRPRSPGCCRRRWCSRPRSAGSATRARRTPTRPTSRSRSRPSPSWPPRCRRG